MKVKEKSQRLFIDPVSNGVVVTIEGREGYQSDSYVFTTMADLYTFLVDQLEDKERL